MPLVAVQPANPFVDGRQSQRALSIRRGVERYYKTTGCVTLPELTLPNGRRADLIALSAKGIITIIEIKSSISDFQADNKWPDYANYCDEFLFATLPDVPAEIFPEETGFMVADDHGAYMERQPVQEKLAPARRKTMHLLFARSSAQRLARCCAHAGLDSADMD